MIDNSALASVAVTPATHTLLLLRHAKSDWGHAVGDRDRPLASRGRRQAPHTGRWLAEHDLVPDLALVSPAARARQTWDLIAGQWSGPLPSVRIEEAAYTFDGADLLELVRGASESVGRLALTGHNPGLEELASELTGEWVRLPTSALAVIELERWADAGAGRARLRYAGRPADDA